MFMYTLSVILLSYIALTHSTVFSTGQFISGLDPTGAFYLISYIIYIKAHNGANFGRGQFNFTSNVYIQNVKCPYQNEIGLLLMQFS